MKRKYLIPLIIFGVIIGIYMAGKITGALQYFKYPTSAMEPGMPVNSYLITSNLKKPKLKDIIAFSRIAGELEGVEPGTKYTYAYRLMGIGGDSIQIKNGLVYINNRAIEDSSGLYFDYAVDPVKIADLAKVLGLEQDYHRTREWYEAQGPVTLTVAEYKVARKTIEINPYPSWKNYTARIYMNNEQRMWTLDNFGPILIPEGYYFVLGDNRHRALDSRFTGPIPIADWLGTSLNK